jgi:twinkle protein
MANMIRDDIDFSAYMASTEAAHRVISSKAYVDEVIDYFHGDTGAKGVVMPWVKTHNIIRFREHEVTLWSGMNGHGKSLVLGQTCMGLVEQAQKVCIASMEMKPMTTLARICRQWTKDRKPDVDLIRQFHEVTATHLWLYDQQGTVNAERMLAVMRYCAQEKGIQHFVLDSLMKCGIVEDDYTAQKLFVDAICTIARDTGMHIHLVAHSKKLKDEFTPPGKMDVKGSGSITDQVDNVLAVWRNKPKETSLNEGNGDRRAEPDALLICDKQRNGEWEGKVALWFDPESMRYTENSGW